MPISSNKSKHATCMSITDIFFSYRVSPFIIQIVISLSFAIGALSVSNFRGLIFIPVIYFLTGTIFNGFSL